MPNAQCSMPNPQSFCSLLPLKTANTTRTLRFTLIAESINSHTLDRVKAN
ncbi:MAG: hypothetical protein V7K68_12580 [Nostoc sp.]